MKMLKVYDRKDYTDDMPIFEKYSVRAIIIREGKIAMQRGSAGDYKILGGGVDEGETFTDALAREVREESGLLIERESVREIGEILEMREDIYTKGTKYVCHSCFFFCDVQEHMVEPSLTESEKAKGYRLVWASPEEILKANRKIAGQPWISRDTDFIEFLISEIDWKYD